MLLTSSSRSPSSLPPLGLPLPAALSRATFSRMRKMAVSTECKEPERSSTRSEVPVDRGAPTTAVAAGSESGRTHPPANAEPLLTAQSDHHSPLTREVLSGPREQDARARGLLQLLNVGSLLADDCAQPARSATRTPCQRPLLGAHAHGSPFSPARSCLLLLRDAHRCRPRRSTRAAWSRPAGCPTRPTRWSCPWRLRCHAAGRQHSLALRGSHRPDVCCVRSARRTTRTLSAGHILLHVRDVHLQAGEPARAGGNSLSSRQVGRVCATH